ncbi:MAG: thiamine-phosphate kinase [Elusimicrobia bacterium RIFOXYB2_FULL_49_7]|nr:MAG: thiamine-phosphate kinase [Elusimicrobia bacterium RIFOXYB2_FULL_49_7]
MREFRLINRIASKIGRPFRAGFLGIGDDCAVLPKDGTTLSLISTDTFNEGIHFNRQWSSFYQAGYKAGASAISDIAAMGGEVTALFSAISIPRSMSEKEVMAFYRGLMTVCKKSEATIMGGDTTAALHDFSATITVIGEVKNRNLCTRSGAIYGNDIFLTGPVGYSLAGWMLLKKKKHKMGRLEKMAIRKHLFPDSRIDVVSALMAGGKLTSMIDISDGLSSELSHLAKASGVRFIIDAAALLTIPGLVSLAGKVKMDPVSLALSSGEEYELLFTAQPGYHSPYAFKIGCVEKGTGVFLKVKNRLQRVMPTGFEHFAS